MKQFLGIIVLFITLVGCKSTKDIFDGKATKNMEANKIIQNHYDLKENFETAYIRANAKYKDDKQSMSFTADIKIEKDKQILVSIRFIGITMAKALITPTEVKYYEKNGNNFFEGDYSTLSNWLGTDLDFYKIQNLLLGEAIDDLKKQDYTASIEDKMYKIEEKKSSENQKAFYFEASKFVLRKQMIQQPQKNRELQVSYPNHQEYSEAILPLTILIEAAQNNQKNSIFINYNTITFNEALSFPYSVPSNYDRIQIEN
jgi:hypothetical protein